MGSSNRSTFTEIIRWLFVAANGFFLLCGILVFAIGVWRVTISDHDSTIIGNSHVSTAVILLVSGTIVVALSLVGFLGGIFMSRVLLIIYAIGLGVVIVLQVVGAILTFVFPGKTGDGLRDNMEVVFGAYRVFKNDSDYIKEVNDAVEFTQSELDCCGIDNSSDWITYNREAVLQNNNAPPGGCSCDPKKETDDDCVEFVLNGQGTGNYVWSEGCLTAIEDGLKLRSIIIGVIGLFAVAVEIAFLAIAIGLTYMYSVHSTPKYEFV